MIKWKLVKKRHKKSTQNKGIYKAHSHTHPGVAQSGHKT